MSSYKKIFPPISSGSFGTTYYAKSMENEEIYVIKEIDLRRVNLGQLYLEIDALIKIKENNCRDDILCINDYYIDYEDQTLNLVTKSFIKEDLFPLTLRQFLNLTKNREEDVIFKIIFNILKAMVHIHEIDMAHGDIKPENILINHSLDIQIIDFGLSCTRECNVGGTIIYESPEMLEAMRNNYKVVSRDFMKKSDIFSLGLVFYELISDYLPYKIKNININKKSEILNTLLEIYYTIDIQLDYSNDVIKTLVNSMISINKWDRPSLKELFEDLKENKADIKMAENDIKMAENDIKMAENDIKNTKTNQ